MWHFRNDERTFDCNKKFRPKSTFNPKNKDVIIETYLSSLEEIFLRISLTILVKKKEMPCIL